MKRAFFSALGIAPVELSEEAEGKLAGMLYSELSHIGAVVVTESFGFGCEARNVAVIGCKPIYRATTKTTTAFGEEEAQRCLDAALRQLNEPHRKRRIVSFLEGERQAAKETEQQHLLRRIAELERLVASFGKGPEAYEGTA